MALPAIVSVLGGTGNLGAALARRLASAGIKVVLGSRDSARARSVAATLSQGLSTPLIGTTNIDAASAAEIVIVTVPFASQARLLAEIQPVVSGKIVVDTTVPLVPPKVSRVQLPTEGCAAVIAREILGESVKVVSAFHNVAAHKLATDEPVLCDVFVFGDDREARNQVILLAEACGLRGLHAGSLVNSAAAEALTSVLIFLNKEYCIDGAGIQVTGNLQMRAA
jgi:NADPH-dependent F420 reductase